MYARSESMCSGTKSEPPALSLKLIPSQFPVNLKVTCKCGNAKTEHRAQLSPDSFLRPGPKLTPLHVLMHSLISFVLLFHS